MLRVLTQRAPLMQLSPCLSVLRDAPPRGRHMDPPPLHSLFTLLVVSSWHGWGHEVPPGHLCTSQRSCQNPSTRPLPGLYGLPENPGTYLLYGLAVHDGFCRLLAARSLAGERSVAGTVGSFIFSLYDSRWQGAGYTAAHGKVGLCLEHAAMAVQHAQGSV